MDYGQLDKHHPSSDVAGESSSLSVVSEIQDYGIIGDCRAAALVSKYGSIDWLCWPRIDSPAIFAALLDQQRGGYWQVSPSEKYGVSRRYLEDSNVLETQFRTANGVVCVTD